jgi:hypothetical protein
MKHGFGSFLRRRSVSAAFAGILFLLLSANPYAAQPKDHPIVFKPGQTKAYASGQFSKTVHELYFSFHASAGQHLLVRITPTTAQLTTAGTLIYPSGKQDGGPGGIVFDSALTESGKYRLRVSERQSEVEGRFRVLVEILSSKTDGIENK